MINDIWDKKQKLKKICKKTTQKSNVFTSSPKIEFNRRRINSYKHQVPKKVVFKTQL